ncbi:hypothetical protein [Shinella pollutisoli]|uniref:Uncharacterized protein n=1 Tax=Shinella pollutisoli TaxID=2250594 RepID=A0ABV7DBK0_9HYPH|nr:hypothetical protein [Shinella pollutisoli]
MRERKDERMFRNVGEPLFAIVGIRRGTAEAGNVSAILTTEPGPDTESGHDRRVAILESSARAGWPGPSVSAKSLIRPLPASLLRAEQVG